MSRRDEIAARLKYEDRTDTVDYVPGESAWLLAQADALAAALRETQEQIVLHWSGQREALDRGDYAHTYMGRAYAVARAALAAYEASP